MKPICKPCQRFFRPKKNGLFFIEGMPKGISPRVQPGNQSPDLWKPYKLWMGDLWECLGCGNEIIVGCGREPIGEHYQPDFEEKVKVLGALYQVNDC